MVRTTGKSMHWEIFSLIKLFSDTQINIFPVPKDIKK
jgi:hypothetical protein